MLISRNYLEQKRSQCSEPVPFVCSLRVVKGAEFDVEFKIEIEGYPRRTWTYELRAAFY